MKINGGANIQNKIILGALFLLTLALIYGCVQPSAQQRDGGSSDVSKSQAESIAINKMIQLVGRGVQSDFYVIDSYNDGSNYRVSLGSNKWDIDDCGPFKFIVYAGGGVKVDMPPECI